MHIMHENDRKDSSNLFRDKRWCRKLSVGLLGPESFKNSWFIRKKNLNKLQGCKKP